MDLQKIINKINKFFNKKKKRNNSEKFFLKWKHNEKLFLKERKEKSLIKKRICFSIKNRYIEKLKIFWNKISSYYIFIFIILLIISLYVIFWPIFKVKKIEITKQDNITNMDIAYNAVDDYRWESIFNADKNDILKKLQDYQQNIRDIKTNIILPNTLKILIDSYKWVFNTTINWKTYIITENWVLVPSNYSKELKTLVVKNNFEHNKFLDYKKKFDTEYIEKISNVIKSLEENLLNVKFNKFTYYLLERELHIETDKKTILIFDINWEFKEQIQKIAIFNKSYLNISKNAIVYIDLRIKNKVFFCTYENEFECISNIKKIYPYE